MVGEGESIVGGGGGGGGGCQRRSGENFLRI